MYSHIVLVTLTLFNSIDVLLCAADPWNYDELGPDVWKDSFSACGSTSQSPINIRTACTTYQSFPLFQFSSSYDLIQDFRMIHNGHTVNGEQINATAFPLILSGGGLNEDFTFKSFHIHWGKNYGEGSEHQLNGQKYSGEIHFVHSNAAGNQYAVLGLFMQSTPSVDSGTHGRRKRRTRRQMNNTTDNSTLVEWERYFQAGDDLNQTDSSTIISLKLSTLMGMNLDNFYRYSGSLTAPPCSENVIWTVFQKPLMFTENELKSFRVAIDLETFRDPQPLNGRTVYRNFPNATLSSVSDYKCCENPVQTTTTWSDLTNGNSILMINTQLFLYLFLFLFFSLNFLI